MIRWVAVVIIMAMLVAVVAAHIWCGIQERKEGIDSKDDFWTD